ncbi:CDP-diacylglycerol diphosphatase [Streptomyces decoyicus]|uniref:CDP-diacylglycerol diphosphatase n=1 Tax=Streptomyces decoyicus TaxID=249567 RepID=UPI003648CA62
MGLGQSERLVLAAALGDLWTGGNAKGSRSHDQLHIHMSLVVDGVRDTLSKATTVAKDWNLWPNQVTTVTGRTKLQPDKRSYRVVHIDRLDFNLFAALHKCMITIMGEKMADQTLIVIGAGKSQSDGYYLLNSRKDLANPPDIPGIGFCDSILICK